MIISTTLRKAGLCVLLAMLAACDGESSSSDSSLTSGGSESITSTAATAGILCDYDDTTYNNQESLTYTSTSTWTCTDSTRELTANGIPDHEVGTFPNPGNPNTISEQTVSASFTLEPAETTQTSFDFGTDQNNAHVQPDGAYHYHGMPEGFIAKRGGNSSTMTLIGWAADGFPIYARYGYSVADDASSGLKVMTGSYQLVSSVSASRPSTDTYPLGTFQQDWEYVEGSGDLDECNGRFGVTPEFPGGIYHYYATDTYPYFQRCVKGEVETSGELPPPPSF